ncbi:MmgE/PrpD family protein [Bradyrhizobium sp. LTSPM299]|uniref:MmgE/PrpD family protein n=1 Tax=Bradyrhizobium sp. LTSPM299 TaxID=1619233 RepID=UPI0005CAC4AB|nr:MmgE/PrpD family protein [Bradyrhizobium sp. LTSPM299]
MKRRDVLGLLTTGAIGIALPPPRAYAQAAGPQMAALSNYMSAARQRSLPADVVEHARLHVLDTLVAMISGSRLAPGEAAQRFIRDVATKGDVKGDVTIAASNLRAPPIDAALANGVMAHADETDDSHNASRSHPGCSVIPAALAMGERLGVSGEHFLRAVTLGYDVGTRVVLTMGGAKFSYDNVMDTHSVAGTFGASAAAACTAGLDAQRMRWVLDYAAQQASGYIVWRRDVDHIEKGFVFAGMPARNGVTAALLVRSGWTGIDDVFSGPDNFFLAYASKANPEQLTDKLGERYEIALTDIKKWTVGSPIQAPLDGVAAIRGKHPFSADQVQRVTVRVAPSVAAVVDNRDNPDISLQHMIAVMLLDKTVSFQAAHDKARMKDAAVLQQRAKVNLVGDEDLAKLLPARVTVVEIDLTDGTHLSERVTEVRGTVANPMTRAEVTDKARSLIAPVLGRGPTERLIRSTQSMP